MPNQTPPRPPQKPSPSRAVPNLGARPQRPEGVRSQPIKTAGPGSPAPAHLEGDAMMTIVTRNNFFKEGYSSLLKVAIAQSLVILVLASLVVYKVFIEPPPTRYFATTDDGRLIDPKLFALNSPNLRDSAILTWAAAAASDIMTFNWQDYQMRLQNSSAYFTDSGWDSFLKALQDSKLLETVKANQQLMTTVPLKAPVVVDRGEAGGTYYWRLQMPMTTKTISVQNSAPKMQLLTLTIVRVSPLKNPTGLGIEQWVQSECGDACK